MFKKGERASAAPNIAWRRHTFTPPNALPSAIHAPPVNLIVWSQDCDCRDIFASLSRNDHASLGSAPIGRGDVCESGASQFPALSCLSRGRRCTGVGRVADSPKSVQLITWQSRTPRVPLLNTGSDVAQARLR